MKKPKHKVKPKRKNKKPEKKKPEKKDRDRILSLLLIIVTGFLVYFNTIESSFHFDDTTSITNNPVIFDISNMDAIWGFCKRRIVLYYSLALNYHLGKLHTPGYHFVNIFLHISSAVLVYCFVLLLFRSPVIVRWTHSRMDHEGAKRSANAAALLAALLFEAHPVQTQAVTYIIQRATSLASFFYLLSITLFLKARLTLHFNVVGDPADSIRKKGERKPDTLALPLLLCGGSFAAAILALFTKEFPITLPLAVLLLEGFFFGFTLEAWKRNLKYTISIVVSIIVVLALAALMNIQTMNLDEIRKMLTETTHITRMEYFMTQWRVVATYLRVFLWPVNQNLDYFYLVSRTAFEFQSLLSLAFLISLFYFALRTLKSHPLVSFGIFWFFLTLSVESGFIPIRDVIFEHRMYLPSVGLLLAAAALIHRQAGRLGNAGPILPCFLIVCASAFALNRNAVWKDEATLWSDVVAKSSNKVRGHINLGSSYEDMKMYSEAESAYQAAIRVQPDNPDIYCGLGIVYHRMGRLDSAIAEYETAIKIQPNHAESHNNLGNVYKEKGMLDRALAEYQKTLEILPNSAEARNNIGVIHIKQGQADLAIVQFRDALRADPYYSKSLYNMGIAYESQGKIQEAMAEFANFLKREPNHTAAHNNLGTLYAKQGMPDKAEAEFQKALKIDSRNLEGHNNLGNVYYLMKRYKDAAREWEISLQIDPSNQKTRNNLEVIKKKLDNPA